jgi:hypothetical protein
MVLFVDVAVVLDSAAVAAPGTAVVTPPTPFTQHTSLHNQALAYLQ